MGETPHFSFSFLCFACLKHSHWCNPFNSCESHKYCLCLHTHLQYSRIVRGTLCWVFILHSLQVLPGAFRSPLHEPAQMSDLYHSGRCKFAFKKKQSPVVIGLNSRSLQYLYNHLAYPTTVCIPATLYLSSTLPNECKSKAQLSSNCIACAMLTNPHPYQHHIHIYKHDAKQRRAKTFHALLGQGKGHLTK